MNRLIRAYSVNDRLIQDFRNRYINNLSDIPKN